MLVNNNYHGIKAQILIKIKMENILSYCISMLLSKFNSETARKLTIY